MSLPILKTCKKRKRAPKLYSLSNFCDPGYPITSPTGPFRDNIRLFLQHCSENEDYHVNSSMPVWCTLLVQDSKGIVVPLYIIEETVDQTSQHPFCDQCRCAGWSHHYVSKRKYHLIIPVDSDWNKPLSRNVFEHQKHLLYGLIHCNGYGHLLCINGIEGGSKYLAGREIMDLWDRICTNLKARKITVEDTSRKRSMELRLLHGIAYGQSWFAKWGYKFYHGSFGVEEQHYQRALEILSSLDLDDLENVYINTDKFQPIKQLISFYRDLSNTYLSTLRDLLKFMLSQESKSLIRQKFASAEIKSPVPTRYSIKPVLRNKRTPTKGKPMKCRNFQSVVASMDSRWPKRRLEYSAEVIVNALKDHRDSSPTNCGMTRQDVRDAARKHIGDTGLLDYVLKSMNNVIVGDCIVRRRINPSNRVLEYTIHHVAEASPMKQEIKKEPNEFVPTSAKKPCSDIYRDLYILYRQFLLDQSETEITGLSVSVLLDSKYFVKEWPFQDVDDQLLRFICRIVAPSDDLDMLVPRNVSPGELVVLPLHATLGELKVAAQNALRDTYCIMEKYVVTEIADLESLVDEDVLFGEIESGSEVWVRGRGIDMRSELRYEGGPDNWTVKCSCGAKDDDGERMVSCDICEVWQHTKCRGIQDSEAVPPLFVCHNCCSSLMPSKVDLTPETDSSEEPVLPPASEEPWMYMPPEVDEPWMVLCQPDEEAWMPYQY